MRVNPRLYPEQDLRLFLIFCRYRVEPAKLEHIVDYNPADAVLYRQINLVVRFVIAVEIDLFHREFRL